MHLWVLAMYLFEGAGVYVYNVQDSPMSTLHKQYILFMDAFIPFYF